MPLPTGARLGPYEILAPLGAGGMGEVYRARDTRLGRDVAIKVLPAHLSSSPDLRQRFEREAKTISSLNHSNICTLFDVGREGDTDYLVMELVEGETLATRLEKGALPVADTLRIGAQIADALDKAHRAGIVHRDLKPGNVMLTKAGAKLMDFGLSRSTGMAGPGGGSGVTVAMLSQSPTRVQPLTAEGALVGTFLYMAPEQLEGSEADARSDIWALGCVLYEMAAGRRAFEGKSQASLIASILREQPRPIADVTPMTPPGLDRLVQACLAKDADQRVQTAHDVKLQLQWIAEGGSQAGVPAPVAIRRKGRERLAWIIAGLGTVAALVLAGVLLFHRPAPTRVLRFAVPPPKGVTNLLWPRLSPDGRWLAFMADDSTGARRVWLRPLDGIDARPLETADQITRPFWSPDSRYLAFITNGKLRKVPISGGPAVTIADATGRFDGTWGKNDVILLDGGAVDSLAAVKASGGVLEPASSVDRAHGESGSAWPFFLPDGKHFLFIAFKRDRSAGAIKLGTLGSLKSRSLASTDGRVEYAPPGYLIYPSGGTLLAQAFDLGAAKTTGDPVPVGEDIAMGSESGDFTVSRAGMMAYRSEKAGQESRLRWIGRDGKDLGDAAPPGTYQDIALSRDGRLLATSIGSGAGQQDIWVRDLGRGVSQRLTFEASHEVWPVWSPDGQRVAFATDAGGEFRCVTMAANGQGTPDTLVASGGQQGPTDWSSDGSTIISAALGPQQWDLWAQPATGREKPRVVLQTRFAETTGRLSPDGRWLAYVSNESGRNEVYVVPYPNFTGKWQISTAGGNAPRWRADGKELFFRVPDGTLAAVAVNAGSNFEIGTLQALFKAPPLLIGNNGGPRWTVTADGQRFLFNTPASGTNARFIVVTDWTAELERR